MYARVKSSNSTVFLIVNESETIGDIAARAAAQAGLPTNPPPPLSLGETVLPSDLPFTSLASKYDVDIHSTKGTLLHV